MNAKRTVDKSWSPLAKRVVTVWLVWHLAALVFAAGAAEPSAPIIQRGWSLFSWYLQSLNLNHAYRFYSPEPGPTMIMGYIAVLPDGTEITKDPFPQRDDYGPRLRYQRHLALTNALSGPKPAAQTLAHSYARHLQQTLGAESVEIFRLAHQPMSIPEAQQGADPRDEVFYLPPDRLGRLVRDARTGELIWEADEQRPPGMVGP